MKASVLVALALCVAAVAAQGTWYTYDEQTVDHYDTTNGATYTQRYFVNDTYYGGAGKPIFIFLGGEAPLEVFAFQETSAIYWASEYEALYVGIEHRFYGESLPVNNYETESLRYLSSQQALADAAQFISYYNATLDNPGPWVVFGCSYSGALSSWFRLKFPQIVIGSIAPSGPVHATLNQNNYLGWFSEVAPASCVDAVKTGVAQVNDMWATAAGRANLSSIFYACEPLATEDEFFFKWTLATNLGSEDQFDSPFMDYPLTEACDLMTSSSDVLSNWAKVNGGSASSCNDFSEANYIAAMQNTSSQDRSWEFQKCSEFGFFKGSTNGSSVFFDDLPYEHLMGWCEQIYGIDNMTPDVDYTNEYYGGYDLHATNVLFTNGLNDPWHLLSINANNTWGVESTVYESAGHCATMTAPTDNDPPSLTFSREYVDKTLGKWIAEWESRQ